MSFAGLVALLAFFLAPALAHAALTITAIPLQQTPLAVNDQGEVLFNGLGFASNYVWLDGKLTEASAPASDPTARFTIPETSDIGDYGPAQSTYLNNSGLVVGSVITSSGRVPGYWDSENSGTFTPMSASDASIDGSPVTAGWFNAVDDDGEAIGFMSNSSGSAYIDVPAQSGLPTGTPEPVPSSVDGITIGAIWAISPDYELTSNNDEDAILIDREDGTATETNIASLGSQLADNGSIAGEIGGLSGSGEYLRTADGDETEFASSDSDPSDYYITAINDSGDAVGAIGGDAFGVGVATLWEGPDDPVPLASLLPADSGWSDLLPSAISDNGYIAGSGTYDGKAQEGFLIGPAESTVSGTVYEDSCSDDSCTQSGLPGEQMVLSGTASSGQAYTTSTTTGDDGSYELDAPAGQYTVGPSQDGATIDGTGFDPQPQAETLGASPVTGVNFSACTPDADAVDDDSSGSTAESVRSAGLLAHVASAPRDTASDYVSPCKSVYTLTLSAKIPQSRIVDPSLNAHYNRSPDPSKVEYGKESFDWLDLLHTPKVIKDIIGKDPEYPECIFSGEVNALSSENDKAEWYTYIDGGSLGSATAQFVWNESTQGVHVVPVPSVTTATLTRVFKYTIKYRSGESIPNECSETATVPVLSLPIGGDDKADLPAMKGTNQFGWIVTWGFPFDAPGVSVSTEKGVLKSFADQHCAACVELFEHYDKLPLVERLPIELAAGYGLGTAEVKGFTLLPKLIETSLSKFKFLTGVPEAMADLASVEHYLHKRHTAATAHEVYEALGELSGEFDPDHYPIMGAIIRGSFKTNKLYLADQNQKVIVAGTSLGLSIATTKFPTISLKVTRSYLATTHATSPTTQTLPWNSSTSTISTSNPTFGGNPTGVLADASKGGAREYASGKSAVDNLKQATTGTLNLFGVLKGGGEWTSADHYNNALLDAPDPPTCSDSATAPAHSICWTFSDTRP